MKASRNDLGSDNPGVLSLNCYAAVASVGLRLTKTKRQSGWKEAAPIVRDWASSLLLERQCP